MFPDERATELAKVLTSRLPPEVLTAVVAALLVTPTEKDFERRRTYRAPQFREALGNISTYTWEDLKRRGKIPPGAQISPQITIWSEEQVIATIAALAEENAAKAVERAARAERAKQPRPRSGPRHQYLRPVPGHE